MSKHDQRKYCWPRYSLRALWIAVTVIAVASAWLGARYRAKLRERDAVNTLTREKIGEVVYDWQYDPEKWINPSATPPGPSWIRGLFGDDFFANVHLVAFGKTYENPDSDLSPLNAFPRLKRLDLRTTLYSDSAFVHVEGLTELEWLRMSYSDYGDAALAHLEGLTELKELDLLGTRVTGSGLSHLKRMKKLETLYLPYRVNDDGLAHLANLKNLRVLLLSNTQITDEGMVHLKGLFRLEHLEISETRVTDAGLVYLSDLRQLKILDISCENVTDAGLVHLTGLKKLETISLDGKITKGGVRSLQEALPNLKKSILPIELR